ncbi:beta-aspartyl-peptidase [Corynebacterium lehmanniae]
MFLIKGARVFAPADLGVVDVLVESDRILHIGEVDHHVIQRVPEAEVVNADGLTLCPGFLDPHVHLIGGGGEGGFENRTPGIAVKESALCGVTTVVGLLGTDGVSRTTVDLLAKARGLEAQGLTTYIFTGNYRVPTRTVGETVIDDMVVIDKVIGVGEVAIADNRSSCPTTQELSRLVSDAHVGGLLTGKAGVVHFHVGKEVAKLSQLHELIDAFDVPAHSLYATHISRNDDLLRDAAALSNKGAFVDITADENTHADIAKFVEMGGNLAQLTVSSDSNGSLPTFDEAGNLTGIDVAHQNHLYNQVWCAGDAIGLENALRLVTANTARALALPHKGRIEEGADADILLVDDNRDLVHEWARGKQLVKDGKSVVKGGFDE